MDPYDKMLAAGPPEPPTYSVRYETEVFPEGEYLNAGQIEAYLRERLGKSATITAVEHDEVPRYAVEDYVDDVEHEDDARDEVEKLIGTGGPMMLALDGITVHMPEDDEPDWDAIAKDRKIEEDWSR